MRLFNILKEEEELEHPKGCPTNSVANVREGEYWRKMKCYVFVEMHNQDASEDLKCDRSAFNDFSSSKYQLLTVIIRKYQSLMRSEIGALSS